MSNISDKKRLFRSYYSSKYFLDNVILPPRSTFHHYRVELFATGKRKVFRRIREVYRSKKHVQKFLTRCSPKNVYFTPTQWLDPVNVRKQKDKNISDILLSCPLYFDIDLKLLSKKSLKGAVEMTEKLIVFLEETYSSYPDLVVFSGRQGFHVYYWDWDDIDFAELGPQERIRAFMKNRNKLLDVIKQKAIIVDTSVTADPWRILRLPGTLHGDTNLVAKKVNNLFDLSACSENFIIETLSAPKYVQEK